MAFLFVNNSNNNFFACARLAKNLFCPFFSKASTAKEFQALLLIVIQSTHTMACLFWLFFSKINISRAVLGANETQSTRSKSTYTGGEILTKLSWKKKRKP